MNRTVISLLSIVFIGFNTLAQDSIRTVVAQKGDGIFSILRKEGLNPSKYYSDFIELNTKNIKNGSELYLGRTYKIPYAPDSFKAMGRIVDVSDSEETAIFTNELSRIKLKTSKLSNAVYYLIAEANTDNNSFSTAIVSELSKELLINGAQVYIVKADTIVEKKDGFFKEQEYVETINKRYLKHIGKYQRLLIIRSSGEINNKSLNVAISHHGRSEEGQKFADNIKSVFKINSKAKGSRNNFSETFEDDKDIYLAKNILPAISVIDISNNTKKQPQKKISIYSDKKTFTNWLAKGVVNDYAELNIEE